MNVERTSARTLPRGALPPHTVHLCIDMQRLFGPGSPWCTPWLARVAPRVLALARAHPAQTICTRFMPPARPEQRPGLWRDYFEHWRQLTREHLDPALLELLPELAALTPPAELLDKPAYSPFHGTNLLERLRVRRCEALVLSGTETDVCVLAAALDAVDHGFRVVVAEDAVCSSADETHDAIKRYFAARFSLQVELADSASVLAHWPAAA